MLGLLQLASYLLLLFTLPLVSALKFDIPAHHGHESQKYERCIRNFVAKDQLVVVTVIVDGNRGDGQQLNMHIKDAVGNEYGKPKDVVGENRYAFTSHADSAFDVCFENIITRGEDPEQLPGTCWPHVVHDGGENEGEVAYHCEARDLVNPVRHIELDVDIGADAKDWSAIQAGEKLKPVEAELRRIEEVVAEIVGEMDYLRGREQKLRDTNESTNERVKWFAIGTMSTLIALGAWQVVYLRAYFRYIPSATTLVMLMISVANGWQLEASYLSMFFATQVWLLLKIEEAIEQEELQQQAELVPRHE